MENDYSRKERRLVRPANGQVIGGVAAGLARYFNVEVTLVRIVFVVAALAQFFPAVVAYVAAMFIIPAEATGASSREKDGTINMEPDPAGSDSYHPRVDSDKTYFWMGLFIVGLGVYLLARNFLGDYWIYWEYVRKAAFGSLLILGGIFLIIRRK